jgi:uncharacterized membrane protein
MEKDEILKMAQKENKGKDFADLEAQQKGAYFAYFVGLTLIIIWDIVEGIIYNRINYGGNMALFMMAFTAFLVKFILRKKKHELVISLIYGMIGICWLVLWILQLGGIIA